MWWRNLKTNARQSIQYWSTTWSGCPILPCKTIEPRCKWRKVCSSLLITLLQTYQVCKLIHISKWQPLEWKLTIFRITDNTSQVCLGQVHRPSGHLSWLNPNTRLVIYWLKEPRRLSKMAHQWVCTNRTHLKKGISIPPMIYPCSRHLSGTNPRVPTETIAAQRPKIMHSSSVETRKC